MSYRNWLPELGIGIGIIISILLALNFAELISSKEIAANHKAEQTTAEQQTPEQPAEKTQFRIIPSNSPTDPTTEQHDAGSAQNTQPGADDHLIWGDRIAQWGMAVTGFLALIISAGGVWLIYGTFRTSQQQLVAAQRPWLKITMEMADGLSFDNGVMRTSVRFIVENIGNYPARNIWIDAEVFSNSYGPAGSYHAYYDRLIHNSAIKRQRDIGRFLFPKDDFRMTFDYGIEKDKLTIAMDNRYYIAPIIVGCVRYEFDTSPKGHCSAFIREIFQKTSSLAKSREINRDSDVIYPDEGKIEQSHLEVRDGVQTNDYAN